ncbi:MAG: site-2 protease family protein [Spirochaetales bacterium]|jgi:regulator of sigma E protease|nr:site-2 protease family protein [Spirochaetales bacterium]
MILSILLGLAGLGLVIFVHELGHFLAARACGIEVEAFSLGWGKKILSLRRGKTEYCLSLIPLGGYCRMKGEKLLEKALEQNSETFPREPGSLYSAPPWARIVTYLAGPAGNFCFAVIFLSLVWFAGFETSTYPSRIVLASQYLSAADSPQTLSPADLGGLQTGDEITAINGRTVNHFLDLQEWISPNPGRDLTLTLRRNGETLTRTVRPELDKESSTGRIGVAAWIDPVIGALRPDSAAELAGLKPGDRIVSAAGRPTPHTLELAAALAAGPPSPELTLERGGETLTRTLIPLAGGLSAEALGISFEGLSVLSREANPLRALGRGFQDSWQAVVLSVKSLGLLFKGASLQVSGPLRITYMTGEVAQYGFAQGFGPGLVSFVRFLCYISLALCFMNLLPIPMLDGGMVLFNLIQVFKKKPIKPRHFMRYQMTGLAFLVVLILFSLFNDINFFIRQ